MDFHQKKHIADAARQYMTSKGMSQAALARYCDVNPSYMSNILSGVFEYRASGDKMVAIADKYFDNIARKTGLSLVAAYWRTVETPQFVEMLAALEDAKYSGLSKMIIGETGCGKTYTADKFKEVNPMNTFRVTVSSVHKIKDVIEDLAEELDVKLVVRKSARLRLITNELKKLSAEGRKPLVIIDEAENLTHGMIGLCKGIYDVIREYCGFVIIGTPELINKLDTLERYQKEGIAQFRRRFKAGTVYLPKIDRKRDFEAFLEDVEDMELRTLLRGLCNNYGELHDFLEPALRSAAEDGVILSDKYFRTMYKITA